MCLCVTFVAIATSFFHTRPREIDDVHGCTCCDWPLCTCPFVCLVLNVSRIHLWLYFRPFVYLHYFLTLCRRVSGYMLVCLLRACPCVLNSLYCMCEVSVGISLGQGGYVFTPVHLSLCWLDCLIFSRVMQKLLNGFPGNLLWKTTSILPRIWRKGKMQGRTFKLCSGKKQEMIFLNFTIVFLFWSWVSLLCLQLSPSFSSQYSVCRSAFSFSKSNIGRFIFFCCFDSNVTFILRTEVCS